MSAAEFLRFSNLYTGPELTPVLVTAAQESLGYALPQSLLDLLKDCNGGVPSRCCYPVAAPTSWADDHIQISAILGVGGEIGLYSDSGVGSAYLVEEWGYPDIGIVLCMTPSGGHDTVMLDYSAVGPQGEPAVAYIDEDRVPQQVASSFAEFVGGLRDCSEFED